MAAVRIPSHAHIPRGLKDSKLLSPEKRKYHYDKLVALPHAVRVVWPEEIDRWVARNGLNWLEAKYTIELLQELLPEEAIIDCPSRDMDGYRGRIAEACPECNVRVMFKADERYKVVSAASIIAKVTRDRLIERIKAETGEDFGSGYPLDPNTRKWMKERFDPDFPYLRRSWSSYKVRLEELEQRTLL